MAIISKGYWFYFILNRFLLIFGRGFNTGFIFFLKGHILPYSGWDFTLLKDFLFLN